MPAKPQWPTLEGRLKHPLTSRLEALEQMKANGDQLSPLAERLLGRRYQHHITCSMTARKPLGTPGCICLRMLKQPN